MLTQTRVMRQWASMKSWQRTTFLASFFFVESTIGLLYGTGLINIIDTILLGSIPDDLVWLLQTLTLICVGFALIKIVFDDMRSGWLRNAIMISSPILIFIHVIISIHVLLIGLDKTATITLDITSLATNTLTWSSTYLSIAVGLTLTYSVQRYGNFAQSEFFMLGMYVGLALMWTDWFLPLSEASSDGHLSWTLFFWMLVGAFVLTGIAGIIIDRLVYKGFRNRKASPDVMMIASLGVALILRALVYLRFGGATHRFIPDSDWMKGSQAWEFPTILTKINIGTRELEPGSMYETTDCTTISTMPFVDMARIGCDGIVETTNYAYNNAFLPIISFAVVFLLLFMLTRTRLGRRMRAVADNPELAASSGINVERVHMTSAFLSAGISGVGGGIFGITILFSPITAFNLLLPAFAVIVLGTIGSIPGAIGASIVIGFVRAISSPILIGVANPLERPGYSALAGVMPYVIIIAILLILPKGIGHAYEQSKIERLRIRASSNAKPNHRISAILGALLGPLGAHHFHQRRTGRGTTLLMLTATSFFLNRISSFLSTNSYPDSGLLAPIGLETSMVERWISLIQTEQSVISILDTIGDIVWPWIPVGLWILSIHEARMISNDNYSDPFSNLRNLYYKKTQKTSDSSSVPASKIKLMSNQFHFDKITTLLSTLLGMLNALRDRLDRSLSIVTNASSRGFTSLEDSFFRKSGASHGRLSEEGSKAAFWALFAFLMLFVIWLPIDPNANQMFAKLFQLSNLTVFLSIYLILALSLNLTTGMTGLLNFGVIFFASIGAIGVGILTAPTEVAGYGWPIVPALLLCMIVSAILGWILAYPTARLRGDYFAIITISLGEIVRILLMGEPLLRAGTTQSAIGVQGYPQPLEKWWFCGSDTPLNSDGLPLSPFECKNDPSIDSVASSLGELLSFGEPAPYLLLLAIMGITGIIIVWRVLAMLYLSPWGRILRAIREDEDVAQHHGHDVMTHKAASLAVAAAIAAFAGALWAWYLPALQPQFMAPARTTFLVWAAFIIGGAGNNRGMLIGAMVITLTEFVINRLAAAQGASYLPLHETAASIDSIFRWLVTEPMQVAILVFVVLIIAYLFKRPTIVEGAAWTSLVFVLMALLLHENSIDEVFRTSVSTNMSYVKVLLVGLILTISLKFNEKGLLPEVPYRPDRPKGGEEI